MTCLCTSSRKRSFLPTAADCRMDGILQHAASDTTGIRSHCWQRRTPVISTHTAVSSRTVSVISKDNLLSKPGYKIYINTSLPSMYVAVLITFLLRWTFSGMERQHSATAPAPTASSLTGAPVYAPMYCRSDFWINSSFVFIYHGRSGMCCNLFFWFYTLALWQLVVLVKISTFYIRKKKPKHVKENSIVSCSLSLVEGLNWKQNGKQFPPLSHIGLKSINKQYVLSLTWSCHSNQIYIGLWLLSHKTASTSGSTSLVLGTVK